MCSELLHETLVGHAVLLHEFFVENADLSCSDVQEVKKEFPLPLQGFVLFCLILDQLV